MPYSTKTDGMILLEDVYIADEGGPSFDPITFYPIMLAKGGQEVRNGRLLKDLRKVPFDLKRFKEFFSRSDSIRAKFTTLSVMEDNQMRLLTILWMEQWYDF